ncbi:MAG TPA: 2-phospho-L-lactate guanylyltransferase [Cellulomonas sp.]
MVVPVKEAGRGKTRLSEVLEPAARAALVRAMALDTVDAVLAASSVARVVVVTADLPVAEVAARLAGVRVLPEPPEGPGPAGATGWAALDRAVTAGVAAARAEAPGAPVAVLLGDLPGLDPAELDTALVLAAEHPRAVLPDAEGVGTTLLTVAAGEPFVPQFGGGSAAAHRALGHVPVDLPTGSTLRHDVDLPSDLARLLDHGVGGRTGALLRRLAPLPGGLGTVPD